MHNKAVVDMFDSISTKYDFFNNLFSLGTHHNWKKRLHKHVPKRQNCTHLDIATGTGDILISLAKHSSIKKQIGIDASEKMLSHAKTKLEKYSLQADLVCADVVDLPLESNSVDFITLSFGLRNFRDLPKAIEELKRVISSNGRLCILEFSRPKLPGLKQVYDFYLKQVMPRTAGLISKKKSAYTYLHDTIQEFPSPDEIALLLLTHGFKSVKKCPISLGIVTLYIADV